MKVSFVIPSYNTAEWLPHAVDSCLAQTHKDIEIVIVDDHSTDTTPEYVAWAKKREWASKCVFIRNEKNLGRSASRNIGNRAASGDIICVLDADDLAAPRRAEVMVAHFKTGSVFVHGMAHKMDTVGRNCGMEKTDVFNKDQAIECLSAGMVHSTVAYSKELALKYPYLEGEPCRLGVDDFTIILPMAMDGVKFDYIPTPLAAYRINDFGITALRDTKETVAFKKKFMGTLLVKA